MITALLFTPAALYAVACIWKCGYQAGQRDGIRRTMTVWHQFRASVLRDVYKVQNGIPLNQKEPRV